MLEKSKKSVLSSNICYHKTPEKSHRESTAWSKTYYHKALRRAILNLLYSPRPVITPTWKRSKLPIIILIIYQAISYIQVY